jgi:hypothetical protein
MCARSTSSLQAFEKITTGGASATVVSQVTVAEEVAIFYKKIWPREVARSWGLTLVAKTGAMR